MLKADQLDRNLPDSDPHTEGTQRNIFNQLLEMVSEPEKLDSARARKFSRFVIDGVTPWLKPYVYAILERSDRLKHQYILSLDSHIFSEENELRNLLDVHIQKLEAVLQIAHKAGLESTPQIHSTIANLLLVCMQMKTGFLLESVPQTLTNLFNRYLPHPDTFSQPVITVFAQKTSSFLSLDDRSGVLASSLAVADIDLEQIFEATPGEDRSELARQLIEDSSIATLSKKTEQFFLVFDYISTQQKKAETFRMALLYKRAEFSSLSLMEQALFVKKYAERIFQEEEQKLSFLKTTLSKLFANNQLFNEVDGHAQLEFIQVVTSVKEEQALVFLEVNRSSKKYPPEARKIIEEYASFFPPGRNSDSVILNLQKQDLLSNAVIEKYIIKCFSEKKGDIAHLQYLLKLAEYFSLEARVFQNLVTGLIEVAIQDNSSFVMDGALVGQFGVEEVASQKQPFSDPLHAEINYGENSWRPKQSVIDPMQNALDAQAHEHSLRLVDALHPPDTNYPTEYYTPRNITEAWMLQQKILCLPVDSEELANIDPEIIKKIDALGKVKPPQLLVLVRDASSVEYKVPVEELRKTDKKDLQVIGFEIIDQGIGYARELTSHFAPTKEKYPFLRGRFGQGTKMSIIALTRMGCQVDIGSRSIDLQSHKISEWKGSTITKNRGDDAMVYFEGEESFSYSPDEKLRTGTIFSVRFPENTALDNPDIQKIAEMLSAESISEYILDFNSLENSYILPSMYVDGRVSTHSNLLGKLWVQGLEVPREVEMRYGLSRGAKYLFSYDFSTVVVFSGKDRKYLNRDVTDKIVKSIWGEMTDHSSLVDLYSKIVSLSGLKSHLGGISGEECYEATDMLSDLYINPTAREAHKKACLQALGASENDKFICAVGGFSQELTQEEADLVEELGYTKKLEFASGVRSASHIIGLLGRENAIDENELRQKINDRLLTQKVDAEHPKELVVVEVRALAKKAQQLVLTELLAFRNYQLLSERMGRELNIYFSDSDAPVWVSSGKDSKFNIIISLKSCGILVEENGGLSHSQKQVLFLELFAALCALGGKLLANDFYTSTSDMSAQKIFDDLLERHVHNFGFGDLSEEIALKPPEKNLVPAVIKLLDLRHEEQSEERKFVPIADFLLKLKNSQNSISKSVFEDLFVNIEPKQLNKAMKLAADLDLIGRTIQFAEGKFTIVIDRLPGRDVSQLILEEARRELVGAIGTLSVYLEGENNSATLVVPFDFSTTDKALISIGKNHVTAVSRFVTMPPFSHLPDASITSFFDKDYFARCAYAANGAICFPIGSYDTSIIKARVEKFLSIGMAVSAEHATQESDPNQGKSYMDINASTEYGEGDVWDSAVRMLSEALQNSIDAGGHSINFQVNGSELISQEQLLTEQYQNAKITGIVFSDQGAGYTTKGLQEWNTNSKRNTGKKGRYGEGLKMFTISAARNNLLLRCSSRNWSATATTKSKNILALGLPKTIEVPSFNLDWSESSRVGSTLELFIDGEEVGQNVAWQRILKIIDSRKEVDSAGNRGLSRYCRDLRENEQGVVSIGPVSILTEEVSSKENDQESHVYERGLVIPNLAKSMGINLLFGIDVADSIISTQERNRVDESTFLRHLREAYAQAPYELCVVVLRKLKEHLDNSLPLNYLEFSLIGNVKNEQKLARAFFEVFGKDAVLVPSVEFTENANTLLARNRAILRSLPHFNALIGSSLVVVDLNGPGLHSLQKKLASVVPSTFEVLSDLMNQENHFEEEKKKLIHEKVAQIAGELLVNFSAVLDSEYGEILFRKFASGEASEKYGFLARNEDLSPVEQAKEFLALLASGALKLNLEIFEYELGAFGFVNGAQDLNYSAMTIRDNKSFISTTIHELLHLAFRVPDYNHTFMSLLLTSNRPLLSKILASIE